VPEGDGIHVARRRTVVEVAVVTLLLLSGLTYFTDLGDRLGVAAPDPWEEPARVQPPAGLDIPPSAEAQPVAARALDAELDPAAVRRAVRGVVGSRWLGKRVALVVADAEGDTALRLGPEVVTPASTVKLLTAAAVLEGLGAEHRFETVVRRQGRSLVLVGGGDPLLGRAPDPDASFPRERADLRTLAGLVAAQLPAGSYRLRYDTSLFAGPSVHPRWRTDYVTDDVVSPITSLWADQGRVPDGDGDREDDPARAAAQLFAQHLRDAGVTVAGPSPGSAAEGAAVEARVRSAPLGALVQHVLETSDNEGAEVLLRHVALAQGRPGSFDDGVRAAQDLLTGLGVRFPAARWYDGSGLSRQNRLSTKTLLDVLVLSLDRPRLALITSGLPVAGFTGSLTERFAVRSEPGLGRVRAKTGTLTGVSGLAGVIRTRDDALMLYVVVADRVRELDTLPARDRLDRISAALAACRCRVGSAP
jgi:serine-type D-Ala-D-Ala carboxypeptidase/endopeptidase (penicillin-binding protein 4)